MQIRQWQEIHAVTEIKTSFCIRYHAGIHIAIRLLEWEKK
jgi:hypothetical protein